MPKKSTKPKRKQKYTYVKKGGNGGVRENAGRPAFVPTDKERQQVEAMSSYGVPFAQIAAMIRDGIHIDTLSAHFERELIIGKAKANAKVGQTLFQKATDERDTTALIWWTKTQMRWKEIQVQEHVSPDGSMTPKPAINVTKLSDAALAELLAAYDSETE